MMCTVCGRTDQPYSNRQLKRMRTGGAVAVCIDCCTAKQAAGASSTGGTSSGGNVVGALHDRG